MFELGARPHPPRELYRAYLDQSDVFVGIYWQQYGWISPGEEISGLEDEYCLAPRDMPKLIYVKQPAEREDRLADLMARIRDDDNASYTPFSSAEELGELIGADLAMLLAERFDASRPKPATTGSDVVPDAAAADVPAAGGRIPAPSTDAVGRESAIATLLDWLGWDEKRLVTLVGPGGIGKTRLAVEVARLAQDRFDRVTFVRLAEVREAADVLPTIARDLGVRDTGDRPLDQQIGSARAGRRDLIVLDNFEQVLAAAVDVLALMRALPAATFLVTSRARLRVRGEHIFDVEPLALPQEHAEPSVAELLGSPAVLLFRDRARAADPRFDLTAENAADVARICQALEGVPLAIELAAARIRALTPAAMLARLDRVLPLLATGARDVPERQRTIRATVEWSIDLLSPDARSLFTCLGVFSGAFSLDAAEAVTAGAPWATDLVGTLLELVDGSLVRQHERAGVPFFSMLVPVRELAAARFGEGEDAAAVPPRSRPVLRRPLHGGRAAAPRSDPAHGRHATRSRAGQPAGRVPAPHLDRRGRCGRGSRVADVPLLVDPESHARGEGVDGGGARARVPLSRRARAIALAFSSWVSVWQRDPLISTEPAAESVELFRAEHDEFGEALALAILSLCCMSVSPPQLRRAVAGQRQALELPACGRTRRSSRCCSPGSAACCSSGVTRPAPSRPSRSPTTSRCGRAISSPRAWPSRRSAGRDSRSATPTRTPFLRALEIATSLDKRRRDRVRVRRPRRHCRHDRGHRAGGNAARRSGEPAFANRSHGPARLSLVPARRRRDPRERSGCRIRGCARGGSPDAAA
jgi:predicted ATPase